MLNQMPLKCDFKVLRVLSIDCKRPPAVHQLVRKHSRLYEVFEALPRSLASSACVPRHDKAGMLILSAAGYTYSPEGTAAWSMWQPPSSSSRSAM